MNYLSQRRKDAKKGTKVIRKVANLFFLFISKITNAHKANRTLEEDELYQLLILLVEKFEQEYYLTGQTANPQSILLLLIEQKAIKKSDLVGVIGSEGVVSEIVIGKRILSKNQAEALAEFFNVSAELFI